MATGEQLMAIAKAGKPVARLVSLRTASKKRQLGILEGKLTVMADFDAPLPDAILDAFEEEG
jgi:antitoxin (DNA-binding transcriptional repressor) of toxin-antitoxin stability system